MNPLIVANWKMNPQTLTEAEGLFNSVKRGVKKIKNIEIVICPPYIYLSAVKPYSHKAVKTGGQNCFWEESGAFTGEISPLMLKDLGCEYVIVGHSERRKYFAETDEMINKKLKAAIKAKLSPILCIGETKAERERGKTEKVVKKQIELGLKGISSFKLQVSRFSIAYEPVWAIGTGNACDVEESQKMCLFIRKIISELYNSALSKKTRILYGGSVNGKNSAGYIKEANFQGLLVGSASLNAKEFIKIVRAAS